MRAKEQILPELITKLLFCCRSPSHVGLVTAIVENLRPPPAVASLAERVVANMTAGRGGGGGFNGLHLRIEDDTDWVDGSGGADVRHCQSPEHSSSILHETRVFQGWMLCWKESYKAEAFMVNTPASCPITAGGSRIAQLASQARKSLDPSKCKAQGQSRGHAWRASSCRRPVQQLAAQDVKPLSDRILLTYPPPDPDCLASCLASNPSWSCGRRFGVHTFRQWSRSPSTRQRPSTSRPGCSPTWTSEVRRSYRSCASSGLVHMVQSRNGCHVPELASAAGCGSLRQVAKVVAHAMRYVRGAVMPFMTLPSTVAWLLSASRYFCKCYGFNNRRKT